MRLFRRVRNILSTDLHDWLDRCEDPELTLKQAVRELEQARGRALDGAARAIAHERLLARQLAEHRQEIERCLGEAESAVRQADDVAALQSLRRKAEQQRLADLLVRQLITAHDSTERLRVQVTAMQTRLTEMRGRMLGLAARMQAVKANRHFAASLRGLPSDDLALARFEGCCAHIEQSEAEAEALLELLGESTAPALRAGGDAAPAEPMSGPQAELRALKEKIGHAAP